MKRPSLFVTTALTVPLLCACAPVVEFFGPEPDPVLIQLGAAEQAAGRTEHASAIFAEITRLCGVDSNGAAPSTCQVDRELAALPPQETAEDHSGSLLAALLEKRVPKESRALIVSQAIDNAAQTFKDQPQPQPGTPTPPSGKELDQAKELLNWEYGVIWALEYARAYSGSNQEEYVDFLLSQHRETASVLASVIPEPPAAAAGYASTGPGLPSSPEEVTEFLRDVLGRTALRFEQAGVQAAQDPHAPEDSSGQVSWLEWLINSAALTKNAIR